MSKKLKVGIIGTGGISNCHVNGYKELNNVEILAACDINEKRLYEYGEKYNIKKIYVDYDEMLKNEQLDGVSICTWNDSHSRIAIAALEAGVNVLCEKPMAINLAEAEKMLEAEKKSGKLLMIGFVKRFFQETEICKDFIDKGHLGGIYYAKASYLRRHGNPGGWFADKKRSGGGPLIDLGVHVIDQARYLMGKPKVTAVSAVTFSNLPARDGIKAYEYYKAADSGNYNDVEDLAAAFIRFDNGALLSVEASFRMNLKEDSSSMELFGNKAGARLEPKLEIYSQMEDYFVDITPKYTKHNNYIDLAFNKEISHFVSCITDGTECRNKAEDGVELMRILDATYASAKAGKEISI